MAAPAPPPGGSAPLDRVAGLDGFIREWWAQPAAPGAPAAGAWRPVPVRDDFGLWLRQDPRLAPFRETGVRLRARLTAPARRRVDLVVNAFAGYRLFLDGRLLAAPEPRARYAFGDLRHPLDLAPGEHEVLYEAAPTGHPPVFAARLVGRDGEGAAAGVGVVPAGGAGPDAELFRYYEARCEAAQPAREVWTDGAGFARWRDAFREALGALMPGPPGAAATPLGAEVVERVLLADHVRETVRIAVEPGWHTDVYVLSPRGGGDGPWPGLLCLHGHGDGRDGLVGIDRGDAARRATIDRLNEAYALRYARRGYVTATLGMRQIADRGLSRPPWRRRDPCDHGYALATLVGSVPAALDVADARRVLDLLASRPDVAADGDGPRLGCVGLSYGGRATMYVAALDRRVRAAVVSGAMNTLRERLVSGASCGSQWVPGLFAIGDTPETLASIAPRPLLLELGSVDGTSPALFAAEIARTLERAYAAAGAPERLAWDVFDGGHRFDGRLADGWLDRWLRP